MFLVNARPGQSFLPMVFEVLFGQQVAIPGAAEVAQTIAQTACHAEVARVWKHMFDKRLADSHMSATNVVTVFRPNWKCSELNHVLEIIVRRVSVSGSVPEPPSSPLLICF